MLAVSHRAPLQCYVNCHVETGVAVGKGSKHGMTNGVHPDDGERAEVCQDELGLLTFMIPNQVTRTP